MDRCRLIVTAALIVLVLAFPGCQPATGPQQDESDTPVDVESDGEAVVEAHKALIGAYQRGDVEAFVRVLEPSAALLVFHPRLESRFEGIDEVRREMARMFERISGSSWSDHHALVTVEGDVAWLTANVLVESPDLAAPFTGRGTEIYVRRPDGWKLIHGHWSAAPE